MQTKKMSAVESACNVVFGYLLSVGVQVIAFPFFGIEVPLRDNFLLGLCFIVVSLSRSYIIRRIFNLF